MRPNKENSLSAIPGFNIFITMVSGQEDIKAPLDAR